MEEQRVHDTEELSEQQKQKEKEKKAVDKVQRMNGIFDKLILPMIAFSLIVFAVFGIIPAVSESCESGGSGGASPDYSINTGSSDDEFYAARKVLMSDMEGNRTLLEQNGYELSNDYGANLTARRQYDDNTYAVEYCEDMFGCFAIVRYIPGEGETAAYSSISLVVYSGTLISVEVASAEGTLSAVFTDEAFEGYSEQNAEQAQKILAAVTKEKLCILLEIYKTNLRPVLDSVAQ